MADINPFTAEKIVKTLIMVVYTLLYWPDFIPLNVNMYMYT